MTTPAHTTEQYTKMAASWTPRERSSEMRRHSLVRQAPSIWNAMSIEDREQIEANAAVLRTMIDSDTAAGFV
jgi:hypothetical protein